MFGKPKAVPASYQLRDFFIEPKIDGFRVRFDVNNDGTVAVAVGRKRDYTHHFRHLVFPSGGVFDAEVVVNGSLQETSKVLSKQYYTDFDDMRVFVFDILELEGRRIDHESYIMRRGHLNGLNWHHAHLIPIAAINTSGTYTIGALAAPHITDGFEGIVAKHPASPYGQQWYKYKVQKAEDFIVSGFQEGKGEWAGTVGAIELQERQGGKTVGMCSVGSDANRKWFTDTLDRLYIISQSKRSFHRPSNKSQLSELMARNMILEEGIIVEVEYQQRTADDKLRHPRLLRIRHDLMVSELE